MEQDDGQIDPKQSHKTRTKTFIYGGGGENKQCCVEAGVNKLIKIMSQL